MNKKEIINKLNELNINKEEYIVIGGSALVLNKVKRDTSDIGLSCSSKLYNELDWDTKLGYFNSEIKYKDVFEIGTNFYDLDFIEIDGFRVLSLDSCLKLLEIENRDCDKKLIKKLKLMIESMDTYKYERELRKSGICFIGGVDEVGRGPLIGPVVTSCVVLPEKFNLDGLTDSKKLSEKKRDFFYEEIRKQALGIGIGMCSAEEIDKYNIYEATKIAMKRAIDDCKRNCKIEHILIDAMKLDIDIPTTSIIKGDLLSITISAASVIAKVTRDRMMYELDKEYPMYNFKNNKGYPTKDHMEAIKKYGILKEHRKSYKPVSEYVK